MTMATDYLLAVVAGVLALLLLAPVDGDAGPERAAWGATLAATAAAAAVGGTFHGFRERLGAPLAHGLWQLTLLLSAIAAFLLLTAAATGAEPPALRRAIFLLALLKLAVACLFLWRTGDFIVVIYDSGAALLSVLALTFWSILAGSAGPDAGWLIAAVGVALAGGVIQTTHPRLSTLFGHNDLFHLAQAVASYLLYRGALHA